MTNYLRGPALFTFASALFLSGLHAQTVTVTPSNPYVGVGFTQQFSATVTGLSNTTVTWALQGMGLNNPKLGTISPTGLYTAPATPPAQNPITVQAIASDGKTIGSTYVLIQPLGPTLTSVTPSPVNVGSYTVTINGKGFVKGAGVLAGAISLSTSYVSSTQLTAQGYLGSPGIVPFSVSNPGTLFSNTVNVTFVTPLAVSPATASVALGVSKTFSVSGQTVTWTASAGSITSAGVFTAPATMPSSPTVIITATGSGGATGTAKVTLTQPLTPAATPTFNPAAGTYSSSQTVTISTATTGASIRYTTDGSTPSETKGTLYSTGFTVDMTKTVKAIAYKSGMADSAVASALYTINLPAVAAPTFTPPAGTYSSAQAVTIGSATMGASIRYTTDGSTPTKTTGTLYSAGFSVASTTTVKAIAFMNGMTDSAVTSAAYTINSTPVASPTFTPPGGTYTSAQTVTLSSATTGASIRYTTDGSAPSETAGTLYSAGFSVGSTATVKAIAYKTGMTDSPVASAAYTINLPPVSITLSPSTASLSASQTQAFTATVTGTSNLGVNWSLSSSTGGLSSTTSVSGSPVTYTAPATIASQTTVTVTATSAADSTKSATAIITLNPATGGPISVSPPTVTLALNGTQTFTASGQPSVSWSATAGTITAAGFFTAPSTMTPTGTVTITASGTNNQSATATVTLTNGTTLVSAAAAKRFLQQAAFGPTTPDTNNVQNIGFQGWLNQQFAMPKISNYANLTTAMPGRFLTNSVMNADQLRQRVAFALSQITVVSLNSLIFPENVTPFQELLLNDAFTNYRQILSDVTLSPSMGAYLTMVNNEAANPALGTVANENYAREIMQLFSLGTVMLNQDGSPQTDSSGLPVPTYNQKNVTELARVFTGWTFAQKGVPVYWGAGINDGNTDVTSPMVAVSQYHDFGSKTLLPDYVNGTGTSPYVAPAGLSPAADLSAAIDNIFYHPNVGPFVGKQLIQHLVKSNPSPQYISRVAAAFANNGQGVRGDMQAVISAILLDPEARANDAGGNDQPTDGHMQEPALFLAGVLRAFNSTVTDANYFPYDLENLDQDIFNAPSVFNYYSPKYVVPQTTLTGPEFQIFDTFTSIYRGNLINNLMGNFSDPIQTYGPGTTMDLTAYVALSKQPAALVDAMDLALTRGTLPAAVKSVIATAVAAQDPAGYTNGLKQVQTALYLIATSNYYNVWH